MFVENFRHKNYIKYNQQRVSYVTFYRFNTDSVEIILLKIHFSQHQTKHKVISRFV